MGLISVHFLGKGAEEREWEEQGPLHWPCPELCILLLRSHLIEAAAVLLTARQTAVGATLYCALLVSSVCKGDTTPRKHELWTLLCHQRALSS